MFASLSIVQYNNTARRGFSDDILPHTSYTAEAGYCLQVAVSCRLIGNGSCLGEWKLRCVERCGVRFQKQTYSR